MNIVGNHKDCDFYIISYENDERITLRILPRNGQSEDWFEMDFKDFSSFSWFVDMIDCGRKHMRGVNTFDKEESSQINLLL